jgi:hypothetical protein
MPLAVKALLQNSAALASGAPLNYSPQTLLTDRSMNSGVSAKPQAFSGAPHV